MHHLLTFSLRYRFFTLVAIAVVIASGLWSFTHLTIDAVPDLTPVQVQILTRAPALGPVDLGRDPFDPAARIERDLAMAKVMMKH